MFPNGNILVFFSELDYNIHIIFPNGNINQDGLAMALTPEQIGKQVRDRRKALGVTQEQLALTANTGLRFIIELEKGKPTSQIGKVLDVLNALGIGLEITPSESRGDGSNS